MPRMPLPIPARRAAHRTRPPPTTTKPNRRDNDIERLRTIRPPSRIPIGNRLIRLTNAAAEA